MSNGSTRSYLSIGEVLGLLLEEFPEVTISKIRFLESQGLIDPERTSSGYRKFSDADVDRLRFIMREQKDNYLPLKVIKDRLDNGDGTPPAPPRPTPSGASWASVPSTPEEPSMSTGDSASEGSPPYEYAVVSAVEVGEVVAYVAIEPTETAREAAVPVGVAAESGGGGNAPSSDTAGEPDERLDRNELMAQAGIDAEMVAELESFGLITGRDVGGRTYYDPEALAIARCAVEFGRLGVEVRHLRAWRTSAEKEATLFEQLVMPLVRQRNPQARVQAAETVRALSGLGGELRAALMRTALRPYAE